MDEHLWRDSQLGPVVKGERRGPGRAQQRARARYHVGRRLRQWRSAHEVTQADAHAQLGLSGNPSKMTQFEGGEVPWSQDDVAAVAQALDVSPDQLLHEAIEAGDPNFEARRDRFVAWAASLDSQAWEAVIGDVEQSRRE